MPNLRCTLEGIDGFLSVSHIGNKMVVTSVKTKGFWKWKRVVRQVSSVYETNNFNVDYAIESFRNLNIDTQKTFVGLSHQALHDALIESGVKLVGSV